MMVLLFTSALAGSDVPDALREAGFEKRHTPAFWSGMGTAIAGGVVVASSAATLGALEARRRASSGALDGGPYTPFATAGSIGNLVGGSLCVVAGGVLAIANHRREPVLPPVQVSLGPTGLQVRGAF